MKGQKQTQDLRREGGITLIALIITIIILVILAAVSINAAYNSGIINYAVNGTQNYVEGSKEEQSRISSAEGLMASVMGNLDKIQNSIEAGVRASEKAYYISGGKIAAIPEGFVVSKKAGETSIANGLVIYRIPTKEDDSTNGMTDAEIAAIDWTSSTVTENLRTTYDQFVWIPVDTPYVTAAEIGKIKKEQNYQNDEENEEEENSLTANQKAINYLISTGKYPMAVQLDNGTDYRGILYNFADNGTISSYADFSLAANVSYETIHKTVDAETLASDTTVYAEYYREPGMVCYDFGIGYNSNTQVYYVLRSLVNTIDLTLTKLQQEYNKRVESVVANGGFWVGRYETYGITSSTSDDTLGTAIRVIAGVTPSNSINWYRMYAQQKAYVNGIDSNYVGGMMTGAAWDQMMIYLTKAGNNVTETGRVQHNTQNSDTDYFTEKPYKTGGTNYTSILKDTATIIDYNDIWNNIYDLEGNVREWTIEANSHSHRVGRGGWYGNVSSAWDYSTFGSYLTAGSRGSRVSLYVK